VAKKIGLVVLSLVVITAAVLYIGHRRSLLRPIEFGVPIYPGAVTEVDSFATRLSPADRARLVKAVMYTTDDEPAKVIAFYKEKLPGKTQVFESKRRGIPGAVFRAEIEGKPQMIMIAWNEDTNKTEITIGNIAPPQ
jgi:hypothetical protein